MNTGIYQDSMFCKLFQLWREAIYYDQKGFRGLVNRLKCQTDSKIHCWKLKKHIHSAVSRVQSGKLSNFPVAYWCILYLIWRQSEIPLENIMFGTAFFFSFTFFFGQNHEITGIYEIDAWNRIMQKRKITYSEIF